MKSLHVAFHADKSWFDSVQKGFNQHFRQWLGLSKLGPVALGLLAATTNAWAEDRSFGYGVGNLSAAPDCTLASAGNHTKTMKISSAHWQPDELNTDKNIIIEFDMSRMNDSLSDSVFHDTTNNEPGLLLPGCTYTWNIAISITDQPYAASKPNFVMNNYPSTSPGHDYFEINDTDASGDWVAVNEEGGNVFTHTAAITWIGGNYIPVEAYVEVNFSYYATGS